ncbi:hypothetical protein [Streptomyces sp. NRRL WC-3742]|uniref:hypothetical protein n=1 Tax=Streptomyces sp. NRRL WC-3742 TaxID=1463934 RepID=UPI001F439208|nr:hypothetical protein [Streptomyces sp. NRRL WC-3742]
MSNSPTSRCWCSSQDSNTESTSRRATGPDSALDGNRTSLGEDGSHSLPEYISSSSSELSRSSAESVPCTSIQDAPATGPTPGTVD